MFGDIAHGSLLFAFGIYLCFKKDTIQHFALKMFLPHRYLITMMGFFAFYCGWIYNDFMSISLDMFGSCYNPDAVTAGQYIPKYSDQCVYPIGLDPVWSVSTNNLNFVNSLKMKISVIIGVVHMLLGVFLKASNSIYFGKWMDFFFEFLPQLVFLITLFGYMDFLIIYKWLIPWNTKTIPYAPSIITTMINMPLRLGKTDDCCGGWPLWGTPGNTSQDKIQLILVILSAVCVPLMLLPKPLY
jgi:V-type H+-transporting ATPase subunit a